MAIDVASISAFAFALGGAMVAAAGVLVSMFLTFSASSGVIFTMKALMVVVMGGVGNLLGCLVAGLALASVNRWWRLSSIPLTLAVNFALFLGVLLVSPAGLFGRAQRWPGPHRSRHWHRRGSCLAGAAAALCRRLLYSRLRSACCNSPCWPPRGDCSSGPTRYVSLATTAFFGVGAYTVAVLGEVLAWPLVLLIATAIGALMAVIVGISTLRLSGLHFVIFTFGLAELVRQLVIWYEVNKTRCSAAMCSSYHPERHLLAVLLALTVAVFAIGWLIARSRLGFALRIIGEDETVARHCGINVTLAKVTLFAISAVFITLVGAIMAPRWTYIEPSIAFNPTISFQVVIMALLGGAHRLWGPAVAPSR